MKRLTEYLKEFLVITISVTIAFWVENYRENRRADDDTQALLQTLRSEMINQEEYLKFISDYSDIHARRFDSLVTDIRDLKIENTQRLADVAVAYMPWITNIGENSGFQALKSSGLISNIQNDTLVSRLYLADSRLQGLLIAYSDAWKKSQDNLRALTTGLYGSTIRYDFAKSKMILDNPAPIKVSQELADKLAFELVTWITLMKQYQVFVKNQQDELKDVRQRYWQD